MTVGILMLSLFISNSNSLKYKRPVLKTIKSKLRLKFNVCVAEVDYHQMWQRSVLALGFISNDRRFIDSTFNRIIKFMGKSGLYDLLDYSQEFI